LAGTVAMLAGQAHCAHVRRREFARVS